jgi:DNA polymerase-3 subunit delta
VKLDARRIPAFLRNPGAARVVLLHGDDIGMIREYAAALTQAVAGALDDPFRVADLDCDEADSLLSEAATLSLTGGRRVVRLREATDTEATRAAVRTVLDSSAPALVVVEAGNLPARAGLRRLVEAAPDGVAIGCYPDDARTLSDTIRESLSAAGVNADAEALAWLVGHLGADRAATRQEVEKLALYVGKGGRADLEAVMACVGDLAGLSLDDALFAATAGEVDMADRALELAMAEGAASVGVLPADAAKSAHPPVFFRRVGAFSRALTLWTAPALMGEMRALSQAELACKRTGAPDQAICRGTVLALARRSFQRARGQERGG